MLRLLLTLSALVGCASADPDPWFAPDVILAAFDDRADRSTTFTWKDMNDPVMGGSSTSSFEITTYFSHGTIGQGVFNGTCAIVNFLKAPGFAKISTSTDLFHRHNTFNDAKSCVNGTIDLLVRSSTPSYKGYRLGWAAKDVPRTSMYGGGSFKAGFLLADSTDWQTVKIPMSAFSYDWSGFTGRCDTKDPNGHQHHCCGTTGNSSMYCPTSGFLSTLTDLEVWAEGVVGDFHIEIKYIGASRAAPTPAPPTTVCKKSEFCCPDAKHCLTPTKTSCKANKNACATGDVCCPLTEICVTPGAACKSPCADGGSYCCPDVDHCLTPVNPGVFCDSNNAKCGPSQVCCPLTKLCVTAGATCTPP